MTPRPALPLAALVLLAVLVGTAAAAQDRPLVQPTRDVTVTYRVEGAAADAIPGGISGPLRLSWDAAHQRLRAEADGRPQAVLVDLPHRTATMLDTAMRAVVALPLREKDLQALTLAGARLTRRGSGDVAGRACTNWDVQASRGAGTVCLTADGVALRGEGMVNGRQGSFTATDVVFGPVPPELFAVPSGLLFPGHAELRPPMSNRSRHAAIMMAASATVCSATVCSVAWAQDRPPTTPTRDVDVTYRAGQGDKVVQQRSRFRASDQRLRVDTPTPGVYAIVDYRAHTLAMVSDAERAVLDMPAPAGPAPGGLPAMAPPAAPAIVRRGTDQVAGLACTEWETTDTTGQPTLACFTDDGVLLRARRGAQVLVVAARVAYGDAGPGRLHGAAGLRPHQHAGAAVSGDGARPGQPVGL